ncbi:MAG: serine/threonine protein kinase [Gemmatimonadaceae bacterium]|nr:serine/threonine protein kinase [Gemmatimonadaceae bacterium]
MSHAPDFAMPLDLETLRTRLSSVVQDQYELGDVLGVGASAAVFRGRDRVLGRDVAIKVMDPALAPTTELEAMFLQEARLVASVEHPHIVPLYGAESRDGLLFLIMRLLDGRSLTMRIERDGPLIPAYAARIALDVARALDAAHARGIVHRDIKPDNVLLDASGRAFVTDFGIAHVMTHARGEQVDMTSGTPDYMSPEQLLGEETDGRTDVYAVGVLLFEMLTGRPPFAANSVAAVMAKHMTQAPPRLAAVRPDVPTALTALVEDALQKDRAARPTAAQLVARLEAALTPDALRSPSQVRRAQRRRRYMILGALGTTGASLLGLLLVILWRVLSLVFADGGEPTLNAFYDAIPASVLASARADGSLQPTERVAYAFIQRGHDDRDAMLITDSMVIRRTPSGARRVSFGDTRMDIARQLNLFGRSVGLLIATRPDGRRDTLFTEVTGVEAMRLGSALASLAATAKRSEPPR